MSKSQIMEEIPRLTHSERREIMALLMQVESDAAVLEECDQAALERFQFLDALEDEHESQQAR